MTPDQQHGRLAILSTLTDEQVALLAVRRVTRREIVQVQRDRRRQLVRALCAIVAPDQAMSAAAQAASTAFGRYLAASWRSDQFVAPLDPGERRSTLMALAKLQGGRPLAWRRLYDIAMSRD